MKSLCVRRSSKQSLRKSFRVTSLKSEPDDISPLIDAKGSAELRILNLPWDPTSLQLAEAVSFLIRVLIYAIGPGFLRYICRASLESIPVFVLITSLPSSSRFLSASIIASRHASSAIPSSTQITVLCTYF